MIQKALKGTQEEYTMFENNIMWSREDCIVCWICKDRKHKKYNLQNIFNWVDKKYILDIRIWKNSKNSIESIKIKNYCGKEIVIKFRLSKTNHKNKCLVLDDIKNK